MKLLIFHPKTGLGPALPSLHSLLPPRQAARSCEPLRFAGNGDFVEFVSQGFQREVTSYIVVLGALPTLHLTETFLVSISMRRVWGRKMSILFKKQHGNLEKVMWTGHSRSRRISELPNNKL